MTYRWWNDLNCYCGRSLDFRPFPPFANGWRAECICGKATHVEGNRIVGQWAGVAAWQSAYEHERKARLNVEARLQGLWLTIVAALAGGALIYWAEDLVSFATSPTGY